MKPSNRRSITLALLPILALLFLPASMPAANDAGRDFARCVNSCVIAGQTCHGQCQVDCGRLFPPNSEGRGACVKACKELCISTRKECKMVCKAIKNGASPVDPG